MKSVSTQKSELLNGNQNGFNHSNFSSFAPKNVQQAYSPMQETPEAESGGEKSKMAPLNHKKLRENIDEMFDPGLSMPRTSRFGKRSLQTSTRSSGGINGVIVSGALNGTNTPKNSNFKSPYTLTVGEPQRLDLTNLQVTTKFPDRELKLSSNKAVVDSVFSPRAHRKQVQSNSSPMGRFRDHGSPFTVPDDNVGNPGPSGDNIHTSGLKKKMRDSKLLGDASRRAGRDDSEAAAYLKQAMLADNLENYDGESAACNCIGVNYHLLAKQELKKEKDAFENGRTIQSKSAFGSINLSGADLITAAGALADSLKDDEEYLNGNLNGHLNVSSSSVERMSCQGLLERALSYHHQHLEVADPKGTIVANSNLGLVYLDLQDYESSTKYHQNALKHAIMIRDVISQATALGNMALVGKLEGNFEVAQKCMRQHLELVADIQDLDAESIALQDLGQLALYNNDYEHASELFARAHEAAEQNGSSGLLNAAKCQYGISKGKFVLEDRLKQIAQGMANA